MDTQPTTPTPPPADDSDSLESTPTVVEQPTHLSAMGAPVAPPEQAFTPPPKPPHHHNFITLLNAGDLVIRTTNDTRHIQIDHGLMHVKADNVTVFLDI